MKYLKIFNEHISDNQHKEVAETCKDILLDLKDDGFDCNVITSTRTWAKDIQIIIRRDKFTIGDIQECTKRLTSYLNSNGLGLDYWDWGIIGRAASSNSIIINIMLSSILNYYSMSFSTLYDPKHKDKKINESNSKSGIDYSLLQDTLQDLSDEYDISIDYIDNHWGLQVKLKASSSNIPSEEDFNKIISRTIQNYYLESGVRITIYTPLDRYSEFIGGTSYVLYMSVIFSKDDNIRNRNYFNFF